MAAAPKDTAPPDNQEDRKAAAGRPVGVGSTTFGSAGLRLFDHGYEPLPIIPGKKRPVHEAWTTLAIELPTVERWSREFRRYGVGLRTGALVGVDVDVVDPELAHHIDQLIRSRLGDTLTRVGLWPKRLLPYQTDAPFAKLVSGTEGAKVEILGRGQQFVAFGIHPDTGRPYHWAAGESPLDVAIEDLPRVDEHACRALLAEIAPLLPSPPPRRTSAQPKGRDPAGRRAPGPAGPVRDDRGIVVDGRDGWLSTIAYHAVHDALVAGHHPDRSELAQAVWGRFQSTSDLGRLKSCGGRYEFRDAERKIEDKLRLLAEGRLPVRGDTGVEADYRAPTLTAEQARDRLSVELQVACDRFAAWHANPDEPCPQIGIRATVGLGKSVSARRHLIALRERLIAAGAPSRILVLVPTHVLAEEAAGAWRQEGVGLAVLRGYEAKHPMLRQPMCRDLDAVRAAVAARLIVHETACAGSGRSCRHFAGCLKQQNRAELAAADVVIAAHDALFTGFAMETSAIGVIVIDEGCWQRAERTIHGLHVESFTSELIGYSLRGCTSDDAIADLHNLRQCVANALAVSGPVSRGRLLDVGLDADACRLAAQLEERRLRDPGLFPGMSVSGRKQAMEQVQINERTHRFIEIWRAMHDLVAGDQEHDGRLHVRPTSAGLHEIVATGVRPIHPTLRGKPILHLDATLRPELARSVLPGLEVQEIDASAPHMSLRLVTGSFGKGQLCRDPRAGDAENRRRANRLAEIVGYVRWQALRFAPGRVLVVTYKDCEDAFSAIPGAETAHFNAIAGLDAYRGVRLLIVVGRPLPSDADLAPLSGAFFRHLPSGGYHRASRGVRMRNGSSRAVMVRTHADDRAEVLRAAICDDQLIQAIGRGRGVNRTAANPLEVHVLADVALPLVHDQVVSWDAVAPDVVQHMLLAGVAVDSPSDAARLHPKLFANGEQAKKAFQRDRFGGQNPIRIIYREMSLKSAAYRRPGRGRSWQRAYWITGSNADAERALAAALERLAEWKPSER